MRGILLAALGLLLAALRPAAADTPAWCYSDQVLGTWELTVSDVDVEPPEGSDRVSCPASVSPARDFGGPISRTTAGGVSARPGLKRVTLYSPNVAVDEDTGAAGTWTMQYTQAVQISLSGWTYTFFLAYERFQQDGVPYVRTDCGHSQPEGGWAYQDGVGRRYRACMSAELVGPEASNLINVHQEGSPGPVNPDTNKMELAGGSFAAGGAFDRPRVRRALPHPVPTGSYARELRARGLLGYQKTSWRRGAGHKLFSLPHESAGVPYSGDTLPDSFDWSNVGGRNFMPPVFDQGHCANCYAAACLQAMMARVMIASDQRDDLGVRSSLSFQHPVDCNYYSQGCSGGFAEQVVQFAEEHGILVEEDYPTLFSEAGYNGNETECRTPGHREGRRYFFTAGQVVGGYYGAPFDPEEMKWELYRHGPLVVNVLVDDQGYFKNGSIYGPPARAGEDPESPRHYYVEEIDHSIVLYGWRTLPNGTQVWLCMNSWGPEWNGDGTIQIAIGSNEYGVESQVVTFYWAGDARAEGPGGPAALEPIRSLYYVALILADALLGAAALGLLVGLLVACRRKPYARLEA